MGRNEPQNYKDHNINTNTNTNTNTNSAAPSSASAALLTRLSASQWNRHSSSGRDLKVVPFLFLHLC
jgi:hypothetical protein